MYFGANILFLFSNKKDKAKHKILGYFSQFEQQIS